MSKILKHIDKEEIIGRLSGGESIRNINKWIKNKYPGNKKLWISTVSLQNFRKNNLELDGKVLKDIQEAAAVKQKVTMEQHRLGELETTNAYQDKINEIADTHLDVSRKILQLDAIIETRMEYWFNAIKSGEAAPQTADKELRQYMDRQLLLLQQYKKFVEGMADHTVDYNVNVTVINDQISFIRDIIKEVLEEFDSDVAMLFMDRLNQRLGHATYSPEIIEIEAVDIKKIDKLIGDGDSY